ncbi:MAG: AIR carboxylase family protein, partial [Gammaproteobacteria bacterium]|nr:AIR carboxylase family protein [Gammaproteobacteria bacterium]
ATVAIGSSGSANAAYLAAQILSLNTEGLSKKLKKIREDNKQAIKEKNLKLGQ